jgi:hypothetical protein
MNKAFLLEIAHLNPRIQPTLLIAEFTPRPAPKMPEAADCVVLSNIKECNRTLPDRLTIDEQGEISSIVY